MHRQHLQTLKVHRVNQETFGTNSLQSCAKIIEKTVKNGLLSLATSNLKLF